LQPHVAPHAKRAKLPALVLALAESAHVVAGRHDAAGVCAEWLVDRAAPFT
jgi:hypothetical protein